MSKHKVCACGIDISDTYQKNDGWTPAGWYCIGCEMFLLDEEVEGSEDDEESEDDE